MTRGRKNRNYRKRRAIRLAEAQRRAQLLRKSRRITRAISDLNSERREEVPLFMRGEPMEMKLRDGDVLTFAQYSAHLASDFIPSQPVLPVKRTAHLWTFRRGPLLAYAYVEDGEYERANKWANGYFRKVDQAGRQAEAEG